MTRGLTRLALIVPVLLAAACGGGTDHTASGLSKAAYLSKAEAICAKVNDDQKTLTFPTSQDQLPAYAQRLLDLADKATSELEALEPPSADKSALDSKVLTPLKGQLALGRDYVAKLKAAVAAHDQKQLGALIQSPPTGSKADLDWMRSYGFHECVKAADTSN